MNLTFYKYQGTGNDFIIVDNRTKTFPKNNVDIITKLCDRHFGIGADGFILLENDNIVDFKMVYYNADGSTNTMCGNGGRCIVAFANKLGIIDNKAAFLASDGLHFATIKEEVVSLQMIDIEEVKNYKDFTFVNTGSPHHVELVKNITDFNVFFEGRKIRNSYGKAGSNVNFAEKVNHNTFKVRTYERGVEDETLACGTGVTAVAIAMHKTQQTENNTVKLLVEGGVLEVSFSEEKGIYKNIFLIGKAVFVFSGTVNHVAT